jgi:hypothetical protein
MCSESEFWLTFLQVVPLQNGFGCKIGSPKKIVEKHKMGPPPAANEPPKYVVLKAIGGEIGAASALAPKIGPLGLVSCFLFSILLFL